MAAQRNSPSEIVFQILGPLEVSGLAGPLRIPPGRQEVILAALLLEANRVVSTDYLVALIWDEEPPDTARTQVQICVSRLRKALSGAGIDAPITTRPPGYVLGTADHTLDLRLFNRQTAEAHVLVREGRNAEAAELLRRSVALWRGRCLSGITSEALRSKALQLDEDRLNAIETYLQLELDLGRHHQLIGEIGRLLHEHPLRERLRGQLMLALYRSGRQSEALDIYRAGRDLLIEELGLLPGEELRLLETAILSGDAALHTAPAPPAPARRPVGILPAEPAHRDEPPHQLPTDTADFVGDESLIRTVEAILLGKKDQRAVGVAVIVGKPGIGKSTTATHIAHRLSKEHFPDGQLYCDLRGSGPEPVSAKDVLGRFLRALGIPGPLIPESRDERAEMYRSLITTRRVLVVLDDAATESQITPLLPGSESCAVLVTSRARMTALPGARRIELDVLDEARALKLLGRVIGPARVSDEAEAAKALIRTVGGLPLALRIVAARLAARPHWPLASMVHRLANERHRLDELAHGEMTIRASLSLTFDGLGPTDRRLLRQLSLAQGPTLPGWLAGALLDDHRSQPSDLMESLVDVQMLDVVAVETTGDFRYRFHEIIRVYAQEQLAVTDSRAVQIAATERMFGGWLALTEHAHRKIYGGDYTVLHGTASRWHPPASYVEDLLADPLDWMDKEQVNLCRAVEHAAEQDMDEVSWDLATTLVSLFEARGYFDHWEKTHQEALKAVRRSGNKRGIAALLSSLGTLYISRGEPEESRASLDQALTLFDELGDAGGLALCRRDLALLERQLGDEEGALALYNRSLRDFDRAGDIVGRASVLTQSAHIWMRRGHSAAAHAQLEEALEIYRTVGYTGGLSRALRRVGQVLLQRGEHEQSERTLTEVLAMVRASGDIIGEGHLLRNLGEVKASVGHFEEARNLFERALAIREQIMDHGGAAVVRLDIARLLHRFGERLPARELLEATITTFKDRNMSQELQEAEQLLITVVAGPATTS
ncbi:AfsR/SARP family transcriptional regulator [Streptomyces sp. AK02-01A]|uniref:AfsR/SARP family transcriptional regulator n=1 Tax=Streptomyces sp. AK02-01A TaxID=3028648 RepID=UPI0029A33C5F|nr:BTAD domain-containing putative transcriptional regulator [Streptomyces sp. AK02-01A]MDX3852320.1 BTAD domain-containing putative transcriptional regulator [Streptomyces sp. AK02-01A]